MKPLPTLFVSVKLWLNSDVCIWAPSSWSQRTLTPCRRATQKCVITVWCVVDGSRISAFFYATSCTCVSHLVWLIYRFKVIASLMQHAWVSSYKQTDQYWPPIFRTRRLQQRHHSFDCSPRSGKRWRNGASVEGPKTCAYDKYDPWRNSCKHRAERQENKHGNKETLCYVNKCPTWCNYM